MKRIDSYELRIEYDLDNVLALAECRIEDPKYDTYRTLLCELIHQHLKEIKPMGYTVTEKIDGSERIYCIVSLGGYLDRVSSACFSNFEYLEGMMINALGDTVLFEATNHLYELLGEGLPMGKYLSSRFEPGTSQVPMTEQRTIYDVVKEAHDIDLSITEGYMLCPSKSLAYYYQITESDCSAGIDHDCSDCDSLDCKSRKFLLRIHKDATMEVIQAKKNERLLEVLRRHNIFVEAPCNGKGLCGKCKVVAKNHGYDLHPLEEGFLSSDEVTSGVILSCLHEVDRNLDIYIKGRDDNHEIETGYRPFTVKEPGYDERAYSRANHPVGIAVDIGTTTLVVSLVNLVTHQVVAIKKILNPQKAYGADVISRIMHVGEDPEHTLGALVRDAIEDMAKALIEESGYNSAHIESMVISGNTTMIYLLLEMDPSALAIAPFATVDMAMKVCDARELFSRTHGFKVTILPWISAYVGGDILAGLYATHLLDEGANVVFVDIGTNGEMVLKTGRRMIAAATAAGPAFEGANIRCGMGSVGGAICEIKSDGKGYDVETLGDSEPLGICGSALIDAVALLHRQGIVDDMGFMAEPVMFYKDIGIYPEDIRQVQLAKAAIMAGIDVLLEEAGLTYEDIDHFYLAGGFGSHLNIDNSAYIGLIPPRVTDRVTVVGNTSLAGSVRYLLEKNGAGEIEALKSSVEYLELSTNMAFNNAYVLGMTFGELKL